jgi:hypothetical protein
MSAPEAATTVADMLEKDALLHARVHIDRDIVWLNSRDFPLFAPVPFTLSRVVCQACEIDEGNMMIDDPRSCDAGIRFVDSDPCFLFA